MEQYSHLAAEILGFGGERTSRGHLFQGRDVVHNAVEPLFGGSESASGLDVICY